MMSHRDRKASAGFVSGFLAMTAFLVFVAAMTLGLGPRDDRNVPGRFGGGREPMSETTPSRLAEALIVGLAAAAFYLVRRKPVPMRSAYPDLAGNFAL